MPVQVFVAEQRDWYIATVIDDPQHDGHAPRLATDPHRRLVAVKFSNGMCVCMY